MPKVKASGYSGTPLAKKLGLKDGQLIRLISAPSNYKDFFENFPEVNICSDVSIKKDLIHLFATDRNILASELLIARKEIAEHGMIWVSWPKKTSKVKSDITEDLIRKIAIELNLVDIKVCAVNDVWSGLKLVIPVKSRKD